MKKDVETKLYWLVKYCLSGSNIQQIKCSPSQSFSSEYACDERNNCQGFYKIGTDIFESKSDAIARAEELRMRKIASLKKQLKKLEDMKFLCVEADHDD